MDSPFYPPLCPNAHASKQHGDNWELCYCNIYGNSVKNGNVYREPHPVYENDSKMHAITSKTAYLSLTDSQNNIGHRQCIFCEYDEGLVLRSYPPADCTTNSKFIPTPSDIACICYTILCTQEGRIVNNFLSTVYNYNELDVVSVRHTVLGISHSAAVCANIEECKALVRRYEMRIGFFDTMLVSKIWSALRAPYEITKIRQELMELFQ